MYFPSKKMIKPIIVHFILSAMIFEYDFWRCADKLPQTIGTIVGKYPFITTCFEAILYIIGVCTTYGSISTTKYNKYTKIILSFLISAFMIYCFYILTYLIHIIIAFSI